MALIVGGTYAYWQWETAAGEHTSVEFNTSIDIEKYMLNEGVFDKDRLVLMLKEELKRQEEMKKLLRELKKGRNDYENLLPMTINQ